MDIFSHGLYGGVAFGRKSKKDYITAFLFGVGPDVLAFAPFFVAVIFGLTSWPIGNFGPPNIKIMPEYVYFLYSISHSFIIYGIFFLLLLFFGKKIFAILTLGWPLHILIDIPTHSSEFFPTPFLFPLSDFSINGTPWSLPEIFIPNVVIVAALYLYWYKKRNYLNK